jgi:hypothetical protein
LDAPGGVEADGSYPELPIDSKLFGPTAVPTLDPKLQSQRIADA